MVKKIKEKVWQCEKCEFKYQSRELAKKCEDYCERHHSCSMEITKKAIGK